MKYSIRKILVLGLCLIAGLLVMVGCGSEQSKQEPKDLHLTYVKSPLNIPSIIEKQNGIMEKAFKEKNIGVTYSEITEGPSKQQRWNPAILILLPYWVVHLPF